ncbi:hypothetical protein Tco_1146173 [Tanacetum coccineum]
MPPRRPSATARATVAAAAATPMTAAAVEQLIEARVSAALAKIISSDTLWYLRDRWKTLEPSSNKLYGRYKRWCCSLIPAESDSLPHAHTQATKTYYKNQDSRIKKAQELNTKTFANSDIQDLP